MRQPGSSELGQMLKRHNGSIFAGGWLLYFALLIAGGAVAAAVAGKWGEAAVAFCVSAPLLFICWRWWNQSVTVYEHGFIWKRGRRREVVRWDEVADFEAETIEDSFVLTVTTTDGRSLQLDSLTDIERLHGYFINAARDRERAAPSSSSTETKVRLVGSPRGRPTEFVYHRREDSKDRVLVITTESWFECRLSVQCPVAFPEFEIVRRSPHMGIYGPKARPELPQPPQLFGKPDLDASLC